MKRKLLALLPMVLLLAGCSRIGDKTASVSVAYGATAVLALVLLITSGFVCKKNKLFLFLFSAIFVVNTGYYGLSVARDLQWALMANRVAYFGSAFLPMAMLLILLKTARVRWRWWLPVALTAVALGVFLVAASPGISDIYYAQVSFRVVNGVGTLEKVYGPWHVLFLFYLLVYFAAIIAVTVWAVVKKRLQTPARSVVLVAAVMINLAVWLLEQLVEIDFEILSVSYIISGFALLCLDRIMTENERLKALLVRQSAKPVAPVLPAEPEQLERFSEGKNQLTPTEQTIYSLYVEGKSTKEVLSQLNIKENTLKFHNKNIYSKLGVASRKQLLQLHRQLNGEG